MNNTKRCYRNTYGYVRWSSDQQEDGDSNRRQTDIINNAVKRNAFPEPVIQFYKDEGVSASNGKNLTEEWLNLKNVLGKGDVVIVENTDRITRLGPYALLRELNEICVDKKAFVFDDKTNTLYDDKNFQSITALVQSSMTKEETDKRTGRIRESKATLKNDMKNGKLMPGRNGKLSINHLPMWLKVDGHKIVTVDENVALIKRCISLYLEGGMTLRNICHVLNSEKVPTVRKNSKGWQLTTIRNMFKNRALIGQYPSGEDAKRRLDWPVDKDYVDIFPSIIQKDTWDAIQNRLNENFVHRGNRGHTVNMFRKIIKCSKCGNSFIKRNSAHKNYGHIKYGCLGTTNKSCSGKGIRVDWFDRSFLEIMSRSSFISDVVKDEKEKSNNYKLDGLKGRLDECRKRQITITNVIAESTSPSQNLINKLHELEAEDRQLMKDIAVEEATIRGSTPVLTALKSLNENFLDKWNSTDENVRRKIRHLLVSIIDKVVADGDTCSYKIYFKGGEDPIDVKILTNEKSNGRDAHNKAAKSHGCVVNRLELIYETD